MATKRAAVPDVVLVDGCRTPFMRSGTAFAQCTSYDLARMALRGLLTRTDLNPEVVDRIIMGSVVQNVKTPNVARDAALAAGIPKSVPAFTISMACISSNQAIASSTELIQGGHAEVVIAGGTECLSDVPIMFQKKVREKLFKARKFKTPKEYLSVVKGLSPSDLLPDTPAIAEFSTGESMGESADRLAALFDVPREAQDAFAMYSHKAAARAQIEGFLSQITPAHLPPSFVPLYEDNGIRNDTSLDKLRTLKPAFHKPFGSVTAGNASFLTDGASAALLMSSSQAKALGYVPKVTIRNYTFVAQDPGDELLLGPAYAIPRVLQACGLSLQDIDVFELHEAFAGQVLAVLEALRRNGDGSIPMDKLNAWGGSLSIGHPFGATGTRLLMHAADRLHHEDGKWGLIAACAAGGLGHAMLVERS